MSESNKVDDEEIAPGIPCTQYVDTLFYCWSPGNQFSTYYRLGTIDDCQWALRQVKLCFSLKLDQTPQVRKEMTKELLHKEQFCKTSNIWELRTDCKNDWKDSKW